MRAYSVFLLQITGSIFLGALIAYPVFLALDPFFDFKFHRVTNRCMVFFLLVSMGFVLRRTGVADRRSLGYAEPRRKFLSHLGRGVLLGAVIITPLLLTLIALGLRVGDIGDRQALDVALVAVQGLVSGLIIGFIEETYFRGAVYSAVERESGAWSAVLASSAVYAVLHFFSGKYLTRIDDPDWLSGFAIVADAATRLVLHPGEILDSLLALFAVGSLLALVRARTGTISWCIGLHAGWVGSIAMTRKLSNLDPQAPAAFLVGSYDGVIGYLAVGWMILLAPLILLLRPAGRHSPVRQA